MDPSTKIKNSSIFHKIINISNELTNLIPVGTLNFYQLPFRYSDLGGISTILPPYKNDKDWKWLDIDFLLYICKDEVNPIIRDLEFLINFRYIMATFKYIKLEILPKSFITVCRVRIYSIPSDIDGSRFFNQWRLKWPNNYNLDKNFRKSWLRLMSLLDYSDDSWNCVVDTIDIRTYSKTGMLLISCFKDTSDDINVSNESQLNLHMDRWATNKPYVRFDVSQLQKNESLSSKVSDIYNNIKSPDLTVYENRTVNYNKTSLPSTEDVLIDLANLSKEETTLLKGLKTQLYSFQIKSLVKMLEKETIVKKALVPNFIEIRSPGSDNIYYFDLLQNRFYLKPELYTLPRGGLLAENMGLGKTLICLSLICLTKCDFSVIPEDLLLYNEEYQTDTVVDHSNSELTKINRQSSAQFLKLADICKECINQNSLPWKYYIQDLPSSVVNKLANSPGYFRIPLENPEYDSSLSLRTRKTSAKNHFGQIEFAEGRIHRTLYLCNTTLVVVPDNLLHQWNNELKKHVKDDFLNKIFVSNHFKGPIYSKNAHYHNELYRDPKELVKFDLIIISISLFAKQFDKPDNENPLKRLYWKRLIIDEGHSMISKTSRASLLCKSLYAERRWAVTGTPTSGLTRLYMNEEQPQENVLESPKKGNQYVVKRKFNERDDLVKLGTIVSNFLKIEPFHSQPKLWTSIIIRPLASNFFGSEASLSSLLNSIMVRHNLNDIKSDLKLPQLHHVPVFLEPSYHNKLSINLFTAVLAVNAVSSERTDIDYMFHPSNRQQLRKLITNLQRATFHWTGFKQSDVETLIYICNLSLKKRKANGDTIYSDYDVSLLKRSVEASKRALSNARWRTTALLHEMNYYVSGLPDVFTKAFGTGVLELTDENEKADDISVFGAPHLNSMQEFFYKNRFMDMNDEEKLRSKLESSSKPFWTSYWKETIKRNAEKFNKQDTNQDFNSNIKSEEIEDAINIPHVVKDFSPEYELQKKPFFSTPRKNSTSNKQTEISPKDKLTRKDSDGLRTTDSIKTSYSLKNHNISYQSIKSAIILGTASSKLSYLASRLLEHQYQKIKSIVFFEFEDSAYYLTELLDILGVDYILYATFINPAQRASNLEEFSDYPSEEKDGITLVMDLRLAAHGLTIIEATRIYFISPVWQRSIEAQAIKRAHRIGQTKEVYVETLVLKDTLEEEIYRRRSQESDEEQTKDEKLQKKYVIDDTGMQEFILKHKFLDHDPNESEYAPFVAPAISLVASESSDLNDESEYSLFKHRDTVHNNGIDGMLKEWTAYLLNKNNLAKYDNVKNQKLAKVHNREEFIRKFVDPSERYYDSYKINKKDHLHQDEPKRKKVRF